MRRPNQQLRRARLCLLSPSGSGQPMSQRELAEAVTAYVQRTTARDVDLDRHYISHLERGARRWPNADYRRGFRAVLGASVDAELGFYIIKRNGDETLDLDDEPGTDVAAYAPRPVPMRHSAGSTVQFVIAPGAAVIMVPADHPVLLALVAGE